MRIIHRPSIRSRRYIAAALVFSIVVGPAVAASLKSIMGDMRDNTTSAKAILVNFDAAAAKQVLQRYASQAQAANNMFAGQGGAKEKDLSVRFQKLAAMAAAASQAPQTKVSFRKAFTEVASECKSCHSTYK
ncbi:cytochrome c [Rhizobium sp. CNPSo 3968]|uniref:cytochrome c n=1 Tax=Rhizobium sp. CNPSo 3968 TaxID=3021408 RepID=UPI000DE09857|nr:cytochrome c [Rhizobium sp. CNPSo 3968]MDK4722848.1 cytochrome c [Rhizobium sp. CNPSo 3968]